MSELMRLKMKLAETKPYLDIQDVALLSGYSISTIRRKIEDGLIKKRQNVANGKLLFKRADIESWLDSGTR